MPVNIGQTEIATGMAICQPFVVEADGMQNRGVEIV